MCGIFAFIGAPPQRNALLAAMESVRHRGQCGFGFWLTTGTEGIPQTTHCLQTGHGAASLAGLALDQRPSILISHWRYSTRGEHLIQNCQPITIDGGNAVIAHNGQLELGDGFDQGSVSDTYRLARLIEKDNSGSLAMRIKRALHGVSGAAALVGADQESMVAAQDNFAIRPLFYGSYPGGCAVASEVPALSLMGVGQMREVRPGEIVTFSFGAPPVANSARSEPPRTCAFEYIYFHSSGGTLHGDLVSNWRYRLGIQLALEAPVRADIVTAVPKSGRYVASGYADGSGRELQPAVLCDEDSFRTFIERSTVRHQEVVRKYTIDSRRVSGKSVALVDDSVVRGETLGYLCRALREAGATEVHARIGSPPFRHPCHFGIDIPDRDELIGAHRDTRTVQKMLGLDSLAFLSVEGMITALRQRALCKGCFVGRYPGLEVDPRSTVAEVG